MATIIGTNSNDTLSSEVGDDLVHMKAGNDVLIWDVGDGNDTVEGLTGTDTLRFNGGSTSEALQVSASGGRTRVTRDLGVMLDLNDVERIELNAGKSADLITIDNLAGTDVKQVAIDLAGLTPGASDFAVDQVVRHGTGGNDKVGVALASGRVSITGLSAQVTISNADAEDTLRINGGAGNDIIDASKLPAGIMQLTIDGGIGNDKITGTKDSDILVGGQGNDIVIGDDGNDQVDLDSGDDLFTWFAGDGLDDVAGGDGLDKVQFTGSNAAEALSVGTDVGHTYLFHNSLARIDATNVESAVIRALGGADVITVHQLDGAGLQQVTVDLAATAGGKTADSSIDAVNVGGSIGDDAVDIGWSGTNVRIDGLAAEVAITSAGKTDTLQIDGAEGNDIINAASLPAGKMSLRLLGGFGDDVIFGSAGNDYVDGGVGNDLAFLGGGNDEYDWSFNHGDDKIEGQGGIDTLVSEGSFDPETINITSDGNRVAVSIGSNVLDLNDVERIRLQAWHGGDTIYVSGLSGTDMKLVAIDLGLANGFGDGAIDSVYARGTTGNDKITVAMSADQVSVTGTPAQVTVAHADAQDRLVVEVGSGDDIVNGSALPAGAMQLIVNGYDGNDTLTGGAGNDELYGMVGADTLRGGAGGDTLYGGENNDHLDGGTGNDIIFGHAGEDVILGGLGDDEITGEFGNDTVTGGAGNDTIRYDNTLHGQDVVLDFDGDAAGGQDVLNMDLLFDSLVVAVGDRAGRVQLTDNGSTVDVRVNADGNGANGFELHVATLITAHEITLGQDVVLVG